jgi:hypothetical protein
MVEWVGECKDEDDEEGRGKRFSRAARKRVCSSEVKGYTVDEQVGE